MLIAASETACRIPARPLVSISTELRSRNSWRRFGRDASVAVRMARRRASLCTVTASSGQLLGCWQDTWGILCAVVAFAKCDGNIRGQCRAQLRSSPSRQKCSLYVCITAVRRDFQHGELSSLPHYGAMLGLRIHTHTAAASNWRLTCTLTDCPQSVLRASHGIRYRVPGDWWTRFCYGCFDVYLCFN